MSRLDFYVWIWRNFRPVGWQLALLMLRWLSSQHLDTFYKDYVQIPFRLPNDIKHSFIFNFTFINGFRGLFCIIVYIFALENSSEYLYRVSYQNNGFLIVLYILLYQVNVWNTVSSSSHLRELRILHFYTL